MPKTLFDKIWDAHLVARRADGRALIYMDRNLVDDVRAPHAFGQLERGGHSVRRKDLTMAVQDHSVLTDGRDANDPTATAFTDATRSAAALADSRTSSRMFPEGVPLVVENVPRRPDAERAELLADPGFGRYFTDHMFVARYRAGRAGTTPG